MKNIQYGATFRREILDNNIVPLIGVYDALSASISSKYFTVVTDSQHQDMDFQMKVLLLGKI